MTLPRGLIDRKLHRNSMGRQNVYTRAAVEVVLFVGNVFCVMGLLNPKSSEKQAIFFFPHDSRRVPDRGHGILHPR